MKVTVTKITPDYPTKVSMDWELEEVIESGTFTYDVERSGSPAGPWEVLVTGLTAKTYDDILSDENANILSFVRDIYYRIKSTPPSGAANAFYSPIVNLDGLVEYTITNSEPGNPARPVPLAQFEAPPYTGQMVYPKSHGHRHRLLKNVLVRNVYLMLKLNGTEFALLKRRHFGTRCTDCYDPMSREVISSECSSCYGTSWEEGYYDPYYTLARIIRGSTGHIQTQITTRAEEDVNFAKVHMLDFPRADEGDILVERHSNRRFLIKQRYNTSLKTVIVHQTLSVAELPRTAPEYALAANIY